MKKKTIQINGNSTDHEIIYLDELKDFCKYINECSTSLKAICRGQCERTGYVDCNLLSSFIKDYRGFIK